jgi:hypothetical protein
VQDQKVKLVNEVKKMVEDVYSGEYDFPNNFRFSDLIKKRWNNYEMVSDAFIAIEKKTLETYIIRYRLDTAKELLASRNNGCQSDLRISHDLITGVFKISGVKVGGFT